MPTVVSSEFAYVNAAIHQAGAMNVTAQGEVAAQLLLQVLQGRPSETTVEPVLLPTRLVLRGSTSPPAAARSASRRRARRSNRGR